MKNPCACLIGVSLALLAGCRPSISSEQEAASLRASLANEPAAASACGPANGAKTLELTRALYQGRQYQPAWIHSDKPLPAADALTTLLAAARDEGLDPKEYAVDGLKSRLQGLQRGDSAAASLELDLSCTLMRYASHLALGHPIAKDIDQNWSVTPRAIDLPGLVGRALADGKLDELPTTLAPPHPEYARLKEILARYRKFAAEGKLQPVAVDLKVKIGEPGIGLAVLRNNLLILGDLQETARSDDNVFKEDLSEADDDFRDRNAAQPEKTPNTSKIAVVDTYDENLGEAVRRFESRNGLNPDGVPDPAMIAAMNVPAQERVKQIELNLERWRWMPADFGSPYVFVNVPGYRLQIRDVAEGVPLRMRVIVGKETNRTPIFSDSMTEIVFSPYWNIPQSIETKEMLPEMLKDPQYLAKKDIEVVRMVDGKPHVVKTSSIDWANAGDAGDFQLRQKPGTANALGFVKFIFPNRHNVYLHDTPTDNLFDKLTRDLSHGCVRVEEPVALAAYVLRDQPEWTAAAIEAAMHAGKEKHVALKHALPVHIVYLTARVDEDGVPQFFDDVYGYDRKQQEIRDGTGLPLSAANEAK